jgi:hypothetical protein
VSYSHPGVFQSGHKVATVRLSDDPDIQIWRNHGAGEEWVTIETEEGGYPRIPLHELSKLITELQRIVHLTRGT